MSPTPTTSRLRRVAAGALAVVTAVGVVLTTLADPPAEATFIEWGTPVGHARIANTMEGYPRGRMRHGQTLTVDVGTTDPVALNLTAAFPDAPGNLAMYPCKSGFAGTSSVNWGWTDPSAANMVLIQPDSDGRVCVLATVAGGGTVDVIVDQTGHFNPGGSFKASAPKRIYDSRTTGRKVQAGQTITLTGRTPNAGHVLTLTTVDSESPGFVTAYPCSAGRPDASSSNFMTGQVKATTGIVKADPNGELCVFSLATTNLIVDHSGYLTGSDVEFITPTRVLDTRPHNHIGGFNRGQFFSVRFPAARSRVVALNVTAVNPDQMGFVTAYPCDQTRPETSTLNYGAGQVIPNGTVIQPISTGYVCFYSLAPTDLVVDLAGYIGAAPASDVIVEDLTDGFLPLLNAYRAENGLNPVTACGTLGKSAGIHAEDWLRYPEDSDLHFEPYGMSGGPLAESLGYGPNWYAVGYNLAAASPSGTAADVLQKWKNDPGHDGWLLRPTLVEVGIARAYWSDGTTEPFTGGSPWALYMSTSPGNCTLAS